MNRNQIIMNTWSNNQSAEMYNAGRPDELHLKTQARELGQRRSLI
jgi:hypothetical protein